MWTTCVDFLDHETLSNEAYEGRGQSPQSPYSFWSWQGRLRYFLTGTPTETVGQTIRLAGFTSVAKGGGVDFLEARAP